MAHKLPPVSNPALDPHAPLNIDLGDLTDAELLATAQHYMRDEAGRMALRYCDFMLNQIILPEKARRDRGDLDEPARRVRIPDDCSDLDVAGALAVSSSHTFTLLTPSMARLLDPLCLKISHLAARRLMERQLEEIARRKAAKENEAEGGGDE